MLANIVHFVQVLSKLLEVKEKISSCDSLSKLQSLISSSETSKQLAFEAFLFLKQTREKKRLDLNPLIDQQLIVTTSPNRRKSGPITLAVNQGELLIQFEGTFLQHCPIQNKFASEHADKAHKSSCNWCGKQQQSYRCVSCKITLCYPFDSDKNICFQLWHDKTVYKDGNQLPPMDERKIIATSKKDQIVAPFFPCDSRDNHPCWRK